MMSSKISSIFFAAIFLISAIGLLSLSLFCSYQAIQSKSWIPTEAKVQNIEIKVTPNKKGGGYTSKTLVLYKYTIDKVEYLSNRICIGENIKRLVDEGAIYQKLYEANTIRVYTNPNNGNEAVILRGFCRNILGIILFTSLWCLVSGFTILALFNNDTKEIAEKKNKTKAIAILSISLFLLSIAIGGIYVDNQFSLKNIAENIVILQYK